MRRRCSFLGCQSGTCSDRARNQAHGLRNPSLFRFPNKNSALRKKWEEVLGREANDNEVICELHFSQEDLQTNYELALSNGVNFKMERGKRSLNPNSVPRAQINNNIEENTQSSEFTCTTSKQLPTEVFVTNSSGIDIENSPCQKMSRAHQSSLEIVTTKMEPDFCPCTDKENVEDLANITMGHSQRTSSFRGGNYHVQNVPKTGDTDINDQVHMKNPSALEKLNAQLKDTPLPDGWVHILLNNSMLIGHFTDGPAKKEFLIHPDGQVQVYCNKVKVSVRGIRPATTISSVLNNIQILQPLLLCDGIGLEERCCSSCEGYVQRLSSYVKYGHVRCHPCCKTRQKILRFESRRAELLERMKSKLEKRRKNLKNEKQKRERLEKTGQDLKQELRLVKKQCTLVQKAALAGKIKKTEEGVEGMFLTLESDEEEETT